MESIFAGSLKQTFFEFPEFRGNLINTHLFSEHPYPHLNPLPAGDRIKVIALSRICAGLQLLGIILNNRRRNKRPSAPHKTLSMAG